MINPKPHSKSSRARRLFAVLSALVLFACGAVQSAPESPQRWLFIFDTSSAMKRRLPATTAELENLFVKTINDQLSAGDSIGVWTFDEKLHTGELPLLTWNPQSAAVISSNLAAFIHRQHYAGKTTFAALEPALEQVIDGSKRLTVIIFCDGADDLQLTPYDDGINQTFHRAQVERNNSHQPFVLVVRTQNGKFIGATVNFPPGSFDLPQFPPPEEIEMAPAKMTPTNPPPPMVAAPPPVIPLPPVISLPPLIIVGTNVGTNLAELEKISAPAAPVTDAAPPNDIGTANVISPVPPPAAAPPAPPAPAPVTNLPAVEKIKPMATVPAATPIPAVAASTNHVTATTGGSDNNGAGGTRTLIFFGAGFLLAAILLILFLVVRASRAPRASLITSSMESGQRPPSKK